MMALRKPSLPLSLLIVRYFFYVLLSTLILAVVCIGGFMAAMEQGSIYPANYGETELAAMKERIASADAITDADIPSPYRWAHISSEGAYLGGDMNASQQDTALRMVAQGGEGDYGFGGSLYAKVEMSDGSFCVITYQILPQYASKELRDTLPNPQDMLSLIFLLLFIPMVITIAIRASRVLSKKMQPLIDAATSIEKQDLDFKVANSNVKEINEILESMEQMRSSLKTSLEEQWKAEQLHKEQISALVHDIKTPLSIVKGNADLLLEGSLDEKESIYARYISEGSQRIEAQITTLMDLSQAQESHMFDKKPMMVKELMAGVESVALPLANAIGASLVFESCSDESMLNGDRDLLERAIINLISNALEYAGNSEGTNSSLRPGSEVSSEAVKVHTQTILKTEGQGYLEISVVDSGPGFSEEDLAHATEWFYRNDRSRHDSRHAGMGLAIAESIARQHGGELELSNREEGSGAVVLLRIPLA